MTVETSLIIPSYQAERYIRKCLVSVAEQQMRRSDFEVIIVVNGLIDSTPEIVADVFSPEEGLNWRIIYEDLPSLSNARNVGISTAVGRWVTWVDVDDWLSSNFLEELTKVARHGYVPLAKVVDIDEETGEESVSPISEQILEYNPGVHDPQTLWRSLGFAACKLLAVRDAKQQKFDLELRSGEDVAYFAPLFARCKLSFDSAPAHNGATYYRLVRRGSMSRQTASFDFSVKQRLAVMKHLDIASKASEPGLKKLMHGMMRSQTLFAKRYLDEHPSQVDQVVQAFDEAHLDYYPWNLLSGETTNLAISYNFAPFADASAVVAAKRIVNSGRQWNVINNDMSGIRDRDDELHERVLPYISTQKTIRNQPVFGSWKGIQDFCRAGLQAISDIESLHGLQDRVYSRSMWPASHYLAAIQKIRNPEIKWIAEFSDPLRKDVRGLERPGPILDDEIWAEISDGVAEAGFRLARNQSLFAACEKIAYALADSIYFTNPHQMTYMMSYLDDYEMKSRVNRVATIRPQPVAPPRFVRTLRGQIARSGLQRTKIGFFGSFYPNRGPGQLLDAIQHLPQASREKLSFNVFTPNSAELDSVIKRLGLSASVVVRPPLPYLKFLERAAQMDVLLVTDADTASSGHRINPYLPSKLSDYISTGRPVWGMYEPGSVLSRSNLEHLSRANDLSESISVLEKILREAL